MQLPESQQFLLEAYENVITAQRLLDAHARALVAGIVAAAMASAANRADGSNGSSEILVPARAAVYFDSLLAARMTVTKGASHDSYERKVVLYFTANPRDSDIVRDTPPQVVKAALARESLYNRIMLNREVLHSRETQRTDQSRWRQIARRAASGEPLGNDAGAYYREAACQFLAATSCYSLVGVAASEAFGISVPDPSELAALYQSVSGNDPSLVQLPPSCLPWETLADTTIQSDLARRLVRYSAYHIPYETGHI